MPRLFPCGSLTLSSRLSPCRPRSARACSTSSTLRLAAAWARSRARCSHGDTSALYTVPRIDTIDHLVFSLLFEVLCCPSFSPNPPPSSPPLLPHAAGVAHWAYGPQRHAGDGAARHGRSARGPPPHVLSSHVRMYTHMDAHMHAHVAFTEATRMLLPPRPYELSVSYRNVSGCRLMW